MRKAFRILFAVSVAAIVVGTSAYLYASGYHFRKTQYVSVAGSDSRYYVDPFGNSTSTVLSINFSLDHYGGGPIEFMPSVAVNSSVSSISQARDIYGNTTTTTNNSSLSSPYWSEFYLNVLVSPARSNSQFANFEYLQHQAGSLGVGYDVILWSQFSGDNLSVGMVPLTIPPGNYNVSVQLMFHAFQPSQSYLNLSGGTAWVMLKSFRVQSTTTLGGQIGASTLSFYRQD